MSGGPGQDEPQWQEFTYGNRKFASQEELITYIDELQVQRREPPPVVRQEAPVVRQEPQTPAAKKRAGDDIDYDKELYTDPRKVFSKFRDEIADEIRTELRQEYTADTVIKGFWNDFYAGNKDMKGKELLVTAVFNRDYKDIGDIPIPKAIEKLAENVREEALRISGQRPRKDGENAVKNRTLVEAGNGPASRGGPGGRDQNAEAPAFNSLSALIRARQEARRNPQRPTS
jgi:hypothetical protein